MKQGVEIYLIGSIDKADPCSTTLLVKVQDRLWSMALGKKPKLYRLDAKAINTFNRDLQRGKIAKLQDVVGWIDGIYDLLFDPLAINTDAGPGYKYEFIDVPKKKGGKK